MGGLRSRADISFFPSFGRQLVEAGAAQSQLQGVHPTPTWKADFFFLRGRRVDQFGCIYIVSSNMQEAAPSDASPSDSDAALKIR